MAYFPYLVESLYLVSTVNNAPLVSFPDATIYVGGLDEKVSESLLWELFVQAGPVVNVHMPKDRVTMLHQVRYYNIPRRECFGEMFEVA